MIKRGSRVRVVKMDTAGGMNWQAKRLEGKVFTVPFFFSTEHGLSVIIRFERKKHFFFLTFSFFCVYISEVWIKRLK